MARLLPIARPEPEARWMRQMDRPVSFLHLQQAKAVDPTWRHGMKKVQAIIKPFKLDDAKQALGELSVAGMTVSEVTEFNRQKGHSEFFRGTAVVIDSLPNLFIEVIVPDDLADKVVMQLRDATRTGSSGDGKIFVLPVNNAVCIRTGDGGDAALV
jgi:nitrogen regulatory protein P-II 1